MKYTKEQRLDIAKRIYDGELTVEEAAVKYKLNPSSVKGYLRLYRAETGLPPRTHRKLVSSCEGTCACDKGSSEPLPPCPAHAVKEQTRQILHKNVIRRLNHFSFNFLPPSVYAQCLLATLRRNKKGTHIIPSAPDNP